MNCNIFLSMTATLSKEYFVDDFIGFHVDLYFLFFSGFEFFILIWLDLIVMLIHDL